MLSGDANYRFEWSANFVRLGGLIGLKDVWILEDKSSDWLKLIYLFNVSYF